MGRLELKVVPGGGVEPPLDSTTAYQTVVLINCGAFRRILTIELLQFYYSRLRIHDDRSLDRK